ncbi:MAG: cyclic nucleotide-binding domain-containing protein [Firmicutes bacterium]|nr:cyclic nucleotide-binding domain-containing protein [Bacillota bacterium]
MQRIFDQKKLDYFIRQHHIEAIVDKNMKTYMELHLFNKHDLICRADEKMDYFYFFVEGKGKVYTLLKNGKSLLLQFYNPLKVIGDLELIDIDTASCNIEAIEESFCIGIPMEALRKNALDDTKFLKYMCKSLGDKLDKISKSSAINLLYPLENRVAGYLLATSPADNKSSGRESLYTHKLTEMADLLGTSYRHLTRTIHKLCNQKIIKKEKNAIIILNRTVLGQLAGDIYE